MRVRMSGVFPWMAVTGIAALSLNGVAAGQAVRFNKARATAPYTAEYKSTSVRTLANGTTITHESTSVEARDAEGRFYDATTQLRTGADRPPTTDVSISDPVAGTQVHWNSTDRRVTVVKLPTKDERHGCWTSEAGHMTIDYGPARMASGAATAAAGSSSPAPVATPRPKWDTEDLGTMTINGVEAHGHRRTMTTPVGAEGNDQPLVRVHEEWSAVDLALVMRSTTDDPQQGKQTRELVRLDRGEPDPALFQFPDGYAVVTHELTPCKE